MCVSICASLFLILVDFRCSEITMLWCFGDSFRLPTYLSLIDLLDMMFIWGYGKLILQLIKNLCLIKKTVRSCAYFGI